MLPIGLGLIREIFHRMDFGMILIDGSDKIVTMNDFVIRHSQLDMDDVRDENLFEVFSSLPRTWLSIKFKGVRQLQNISKVSWEQRPVLFDFSHGGTMLQNCEFIPVKDPGTGEMYICIIIHDVSEHAKDKMELKELITINKSLEEISNFDALTGIYNRRYIQQTLQDAIQERSDTGEALVLLMFDLDHFKSVNDTFGHIVGDRVLQYVADTVSSALHDNIRFGRFGGEEFMLFFNGLSVEQAMTWTEEMRIRLSEGKVETREGDVRITASFGLAEFTSGIKDDLEFIHNADVALYRSKKEGRNRVTIYSH